MATPTTQLDYAAVEAQVLEIVRELLREKTRPEAAASVGLVSSLEQDLGLTSPDLVELSARCQARFEVELPGDVADRADTPAAWVQAILEAGREAEAKVVYRIPPPRIDALSEPVSARTLIDVLAQHAEADPGRVHIHLLEKDTGQAITYGRLYDEASAVAAGLAEMGLSRNETVGIMLPTGADFFFAFFGVALAGGIPMPVFLPTRPDRIEDYVRQQIAILRGTGIRFLISFERVQAIVQILRVNLPTLIDVTTVEALRKARGRLGAGSVRPARTAVVQFTSGSTGQPRGVTLTHANVLANIRAIGSAVEVRPGDAVVSWLPLYSDLGLIGCWLFSLYFAVPITVLSPLDVLNHPERWLQAIHQSRGSLSAAPNFAYELCARRIPAWTLEGVDLSCWRVAVNAGEPVLPETIDRFCQRFKAYGFRPESILPCFGLAESTVALTIPPLARLPLRDRIQRDAFETKGRAVPAPLDDPSALCFFSIGSPIEGQEIRIVDELGRDVPERTIGRLVFRGETTMAGYYRNPDATAKVTSEGGWLDSGDFGYMAGGEFYFTGRSRDAIIKAGRSMSPLDVETAVGSLAGLVAGSAVAFSAADRDTGTEQLAVAAETSATSQEDFRRIESEIVRVVDSLLGMPPDKIRLLEPGCLPRTPNGKIRRNEIRVLFEKGKLRSVNRPPWLQIVKLRWENLGALAALALHRARVALVRWSTASLANSGARLAGGWARLSGRANAVRAAARWILRLHGQRVNLQGTQLLDRRQPAVLIANRSGLFDPLVAAAALPGDVRFADVAALNGLPGSLAFMLGPLVLGHADGDTVPAAGALRRRIARALSNNSIVVAFPDSSVGAPVLRSRFRLDAFQAAMETGASLHPVAIRERAQHRRHGERARVGRVTMIIVREPVDTAGDGDLARLRDQVREAIGEYHA